MEDEIVADMANRDQFWNNEHKPITKKKKGAPFKGKVSDNNEEKFKVQR
jgi:hypothetical protein